MRSLLGTHVPTPPVKSAPAEGTSWSFDPFSRSMLE